MRLAGYLLILLGFLGCAYLAVERPVELDWPPYFALLALGAGGVALVRVDLRRTARHAEVLSANIAAIEESLARLAANAEALEREGDAVDVYDLRHRIDADFREDLAAFVDARETLAHRYGLPAYAEVMSHFAAGERHLARAWSASTDGYVDEARSSLERAREELAQALASFRGLAGAAGA